MKRKHQALVFVFIVFFSLLFFVSCEESSGVVPTGTLNVVVTDSMTRAIEPNVPLDVAKYEVSLIDGKGAILFSKVLDKSSPSCSQNNIPVGSYTVKVDAKNKDGVVVGSGNSPCVITKDATTGVSITVSELSGTGRVAITLTGEVDAERSYTLSVFNADDTLLKTVAFAAEETALKAEMELQNGFYYFVVSDSEGNSSTPEAFRIVKEDVLETEVYLNATELGAIRISITNTIRPNPSLSIQAPSSIIVGKEFILSAVGMEGESLAYSWYLDGKQVEGSGASIAICLESEGEHSVRCLAKDATSSVVWSCDRTISMYIWTSQSTTETNRFVEDNDTIFGSLTDSVARAWKYVDIDGTLVESDHCAGRYIVEIERESAGFYLGHMLFSSDSENLSIGDFSYNGADKESKVFLSLCKYPEGYRHEWSAQCYWYEDGLCNNTGSFQMDSDLIPIWYKAISLDDNPILKERIELLGNITVLYQSYKEDSPYCTADGVTDYIVEFDSTHPNLNQVSQNDRGRTIDKQKSIDSILLREDTTGFANIRLDSVNCTTICTITEDPSLDKWYTSYSYLPLEKVGTSIRVNGQDIENPGFYDEKEGKYFYYSNWNGERYWCEYDGAVSFEGTLFQLGDLESVQYFVGKTGQTTPFITSFSDGPGTYVSAVGTFTSFDEEALSNFSPTIYHTKYFTHTLKPYDIDLDSDKVFAELDLFFDGEGSLTTVQVRVLTDKENAKANGKEYAITYVLSESFLLED